MERLRLDKTAQRRRYHIRTARVLCISLAVSFFLSHQWSAFSYGNDSLPNGHEALIDKHQKFVKELYKSSFAIPFYIESSVSKNASHVDIYGTIGYSFEIVQKELLVPTNWCELLLPHMNVKACTYEKVKDSWLLNIYNVGKFSEPLEDAYHMKFEYRVSTLQPRYFDILLAAPDGPSGTENHHFELEATPQDDGRTFIHLKYSYIYSPIVYVIMKLFGGSKTGFSITGTDSAGNPVYVDGLRGSVERSVVCYYIAILAYLDALEAPAEQRFEKHISRWYDLAGRFKTQLIEMKKEDYLKYKREDRALHPTGK